jgi:hypothetical protein
MRNVFAIFSVSRAVRARLRLIDDQTTSPVCYRGESREEDAIAEDVTAQVTDSYTVFSVWCRARGRERLAQIGSSS